MGIHVFAAVRGACRRLVDARIKSGHDGFSWSIPVAARGDEVDFVGEEERVGAGPGRCTGGISGVARVEDEEADFGVRSAAAGAAQPFLLDRIGGLAQTGGVGEDHRVAGEVDRDLDDVAGRAGVGRGDRRLAPRDAVQEARLAGIGRADDRHRDAVAQALAAPAVGEVPADVAGECCDVDEDAVLDRRRQVLVGEVDRGFEMGEDAGQALRPIAIEAAELAVELAQGLTALRFGLGRRKVGDPLGLGEVELAVLKRAAGEFAGFGEPQPEAAERTDDRGKHGAAAVQVEFGDVLAGKARRCGKPQDESVVERVAGRRGRRAGGGAPSARRREAAGQRSDRPRRRRAGEAQDGDGGASGRRRRGEDGVRAREHLLAPLART